MKFSVAKESITPDWPVMLAGYANRTDFHEGVVQELYVRTLLLEEGQKRVLLIILDLCMLDGYYVEKLKLQLNQRYAFEKEEVLIQTIHTHSSPLTHMIGKIPLTLHPSTERYMAFLQTKILQSVDSCMLGILEGRMTMGKGETYIGAFRRRIKDGEVLLCSNYEESIDRSLHVISISDSNGKEKVILFNCACHPVAMNESNALSSDFPGVACQAIEKRYEGATALFMQGACGDINNGIIAKNKRIEPHAEGPNNAWVVGNILANDVNYVLRCGMREMELSLAAFLQRVELPLDEFEVENFNKMLNHKNPEYKAYAQTMLDKINDQRIGRTCSIYLGCICLNQQVRICTAEGEICEGLGEMIRKTFDTGSTLFAAYANGYTGYLPTAQMLREGGYEADSFWKKFGHPARLAESAEDVIVGFYKNYNCSAE